MPDFQQIMRIARIRANKGQGSARLREILSVLREHRLHEGITPEKVVSILEGLGPTFVKIGQIASGHPDILPKEYCEALADLRANVAPLSFDAVKDRIEEQLGRPLDEVFESFDDNALGSASIAQVHRAVLRETGADVAVKVQRPGIAETIGQDIALLDLASAQLDLFNIDTGQISLDDIIAELERTSAEELDFNLEANNLDRFWQNNEEREGIRSPRCYREFSTQAVLVMDFVQGPRIDDEEALAQRSESERDALAYLTAENYVQQVLQDGFFHADPHGGNILLAQDGGIEWIDFGMMGELSMSDRDALEQAISAILRSNPYDLKRALLKMCTTNGPINHASLLELCETAIDAFNGSSLETLDLGGLLSGVMEQLQSQGFTVRPSILMLGRGLVALEGTLHTVSGNLNVSSALQRYVSTNLDFDKIRKQAQRTLADAADSAKALVSLPSHAGEVLDMLQEGELSVGVQADIDDSIKYTALDIADWGNSMLIAAALFVGSCILCTTSMEPRILGVPAIGMIGFILGFVLAVHTFVTMKKERRERKRRRKK